MAKSPKDLVRVRIGRSYGGISNTGTSSGKILRDRIDAQMRTQTAETFIIARGANLAKDLAHRIDRELAQIGILISKQMIGQTSRPGAGPRQIKAEDGEVLATWKQLAHSTIGRKMYGIRDRSGKMPRSSNMQPYAFYRETGALEAELKTSLPNAIKALKKAKTEKKKTSVTVDGVTIKLTPLAKIYQGGRTRRYQIASIDIEILPGVRTGSLGSISAQADPQRNMVLEKRLGLSRATVEKLRGPVNKKSGAPIPGYHRPLVQPALDYILRRRIPSEIDKAIKRVTTTVSQRGRTNRGI